MLPTPSGEEVLKHARQVVASSQAHEEGIKQYQGLEEGLLTVGLASTPPASWWDKHLAASTSSIPASESLPLSMNGWRWLSAGYQLTAYRSPLTGKRYAIMTGPQHQDADQTSSNPLDSRVKAEYAFHPQSAVAPATRVLVIHHGGITSWISANSLHASRQF